MPTVTAALVGATLGQTFNRNRAWLPFAHAITVGEHTAKVNSCWRATAVERNASPGSSCFILLFGALDIDVGIWILPCYWERQVFDLPCVDYVTEELLRNMDGGRCIDIGELIQLAVRFDAAHRRRKTRRPKLSVILPFGAQDIVKISA